MSASETTTDALPLVVPSARTAALQLQILDLENQLTSASEETAKERARAHDLELQALAASSRLAELQTELQVCSKARDAAEAVAAAAVAELREVRAMCRTLRTQLETVKTERDAALGVGDTTSAAADAEAKSTS